MLDDATGQFVTDMFEAASRTAPFIIMNRECLVFCVQVYAISRAALVFTPTQGSAFIVVEVAGPRRSRTAPAWMAPAARRSSPAESSTTPCSW